MKFFTSIFILFSVFLNLSVQAQPDPVELKDGNGILISGHNTVAAAYSAIPSTLTQAYIIELNSLYTGAGEIYPITFFVKPGADSTNTITLRPAAATTNITISGSSSGNSILILDDADFVIIDGRPGGTGTVKALTFSNTATASSSNTITLINGATNNIIRYCNIRNSTVGSAGRNISIGLSPTNTSGNSFNRIEYNFVEAGRYAINTNGTVGNENTENVFYGNEIKDIIFVGIWSQNGTGNITIDSNKIYSTTPSSSNPFGILFDGHSHTATITKNHIYDLQNTGTSSIIGINFRSHSADGKSVSTITNNFIAFSAPSNSITMRGIEYEGSNSTTASIYYNSIFISGTLSSGGTSGNVISSGFLKTGSGPLTINFKNNIVVNERTGGNTGVQHTAIAVLDTTGIYDFDYNTYNNTDSAQIARWGGNVYTLPAYVAVVSPNEINSNTAPVDFVSATDLHLAGASVGDANLIGIPIVSVDEDIDNEPRITPYRGADEAAPLTCTGTPVPGGILSSNPVICTGDTVTLFPDGIPSNQAGVYGFQWQSSVAGTPFTAVIGDTTLTLTTIPSANIIYRLIVTCISSGLSDTTQPFNLQITPPPAVTSIDHSNTGNMFTFSPQNALNVTDYLWNFGDGNTSTDSAATHTYDTTGVYTVNLIVTNDCGADTTSVTVCAGLPAPAISGIDETHTNGTYSFSAAGTNNVESYLWTFGDNNTSTDAAPTHTYASPGPYTVSLTVFNNCGSETVTLLIDVETGIETTTGGSVVRIFPNPARDLFYVEVGDLLNHQTRIIISDVQGRKLFSDDLIPAVDGKVRLSAKYLKLNRGIYFIEIDAAGGKEIRKLLIH